MINAVFGLPGVGKSIFSAYCAYCGVHGKKIPVPGHFTTYEHIMTNFHCDGCLKLDFDDLGEYMIKDSLIIIDEVQLFCDCRNYKNFSSSLRDFLCQHRKLGNDIIYCSQSYGDMDKKLRTLTDHLYYLDRYFGLIRVRPIKAFFRVDGSICEGYEMGTNKDALFYFPRTLYGYVDTNEIIKGLDFPEKIFEYWDNIRVYDFPTFKMP